MGQLTNLYVSESYQGLIKLTDSTTGVTGTLQYLQDGLGNRLPMQMSTSSVSITGSLHGTASYATQALSASWAPDNTDTGSYVTTSSFNAFTASIDGRVDALEVETGSLQNQINQKLNTSSFNSYTSSNDSKVNSLIAATGSYATTSSLTSLSQSIATTDLGQDNRLGSLESKTGSYATTGSNVFNGSQTISGSLIVTGSITALSASITYLQTVYQTSSVVFSSGSNILGDEAGDTQTLWGRVAIPTGPVSVTGSVIATNFTGSLQGTASYATQALSASFAPTNLDTASIVSNVVTSGNFNSIDVTFYNGNTQNSFITNFQGDITFIDDVRITGSLLVKSGATITGSLDVTGGITGSLQGTASYATNALSSSHAIYADTASFATNVISSSYATNAATASIANDVIVRGKCDNTGGLLRGTIVRISGADGDNPLFNSASWTDDANSANTLGMLSEDVVHNGFANVVVLGKVIGINTNGMTAGSNLYLSSSGQYTTSSVPAPYHEVRLGQVLRDNLNNGSAYITIDNGYELTELHDVDITSETVGDVLTYVSGSYGQWVNKTVDELGYLQTSSFNSYTASMDARTGSYITTGSAAATQSITGSLILSGSAGIELDVKGDQSNTGSLIVRSGSIYSLSNNTIDINLYLTSSVAGQSNIIKGWSDVNIPAGPLAVQANYTGSLRITGSNNTVSLPQIRATFYGGPTSTDMQGYISGSDNIINNIGGIYLNTGSLLFPRTENNNVLWQSAILMNFTTSSLGGGHPQVNTNNLYGGTLNINHNSGSLNASNNIINVGSVISTQNFVTNTRAAVSTNYVSNNTITLNHLSSSINYRGNISNAAVTINNAVSSSGIANNSLSVDNNAFFGTSVNIFTSGSQSNNTSRFIQNNIIGGNNITVSSSFVSSSNSSLVSTIAYGNNLIVSGSHTGFGGSAFFGRFNDTGSLNRSQEIVFAVGTGIANATRRTGLYVTSGSLVGVSGSLQVIGNTTMTGSLGVSAGITGSLEGTASYATQALTASFALNGGGGGGSAFPYTGSAVITGSLAITGSASGNVNALSISSNTASLDLNDGNFFTLQLVSGSATHINPSNIKPGQTVNIRINTTGSGTVTFPSSVDQVSGSSYIPTTATGVDIITLISFDSSTLYLANVKNLV